MFGWKKFSGKVKGTSVDGDPKVRPTTVWNRLYMQWRGWKTAAVLQVAPETARAGYRWGYVPTANGLIIGAPMRANMVFHDEVFRVRVGREACTFFAVDLGGNEVELEIIDRTTIKNGRHSQTPLR